MASMMISWLLGDRESMLLRSTTYIDIDSTVKVKSLNGVVWVAWLLLELTRTEKSVPVSFSAVIFVGALRYDVWYYV